MSTPAFDPAYMSKRLDISADYRQYKYTLYELTNCLNPGLLQFPRQLNQCLTRLGRPSCNTVIGTTSVKHPFKHPLISYQTQASLTQTPLGCNLLNSLNRNNPTLRRIHKQTPIPPRLLNLRSMYVRLLGPDLLCVTILVD